MKYEYTVSWEHCGRDARVYASMLLARHDEYTVLMVLGGN